MPRLATIDPEQANGKLKEVYNGLQKKMGRVINVFQGMANSPAALNAYLSMSQALSEGQLSTEDREAIYLAVSEKNQCGYCVAAHNTIAKAAKMSDEQIAAIRKFQPIDDKHEVLVEFVLRVMETKGFVQDTDIQRVHSVGYSDGQIAEAVAYIGLATYSNLFNHVYGTELDWPAAPAVDVNEEGANSTRCPTNVA